MVVAYIDNMESKIINIYFDQNAYPFKDKERSVIYPITGSAFVGFSATQKIRFFVDRIGGVLDTTWVATTKLPNGQLIYELLQTTDYDDEIGEYFVELTLTQPYSALKGDISIGLSGYQGGVEVQEDEDTGIYTIVGTPTIQTSAVVKFNINYTPSTLPRQTLGFTDLQQVLAYMSNFAKQEDSIVVIENTSVDLSGFEDGQVFYCKLDQLFYRLNSGNLVVEKDGYVPYTGATKNVDLGNHTITALRFISGDGSETTYRERNLLYITHGSYSNTYIFRVKNANTNDYVATEDYVDNNIYEMASASVVLSDSDYAYLLKNNVRIHYGNLYYEKAQEDSNKVLFYSVDYQRTTPNGYTQRTTKKITLTKSLQQLDAADILDNSYNKAQADKEFAHNLVVSLNTTNYKLSVYLYSKDNTTLASQTIDLPLESIVVSATYYDSYTYDGTTYQKVIVIVLATTDVPTIIPVGDLVDGLATTTQLTNGLALKVNKTDIADNLTTNDATKVLSAKQGYELNNAVVHNTGNETIAGNKTFTGSTSFKYNIDFVSPDGTKNGAFRLADNGNFIWRVGNASKFMYDYANGNFSTWVDIVGNGDNAQSLGNASHYWKDLYLKGKIKDGTNEKSLQDLLDENAELNAKLNKLQEEFNETTVDVKTYTYNYLLTSAVPSAIDSQPVIESAGMDCVDVKGNSYVYNQLFNDNVSNSSPTGQYSSTNHKITSNADASSGYILGRFGNIIANHKYLFMIRTNATFASMSIYEGWNEISGTWSSSVVSKIIQFNQDYTNCGVLLYVSSFLTTDYVYLEVFDLTQLGLDSATTTDEAIAGLMQLGINPYEYNAYNEGEIIDSKPTKLVSEPFNKYDISVLDDDTNITKTGDVYSGTLGAMYNSVNLLKDIDLYVDTYYVMAYLDLTGQTATNVRIRANYDDGTYTSGNSIQGGATGISYLTTSKKKIVALKFDFSSGGTATLKFNKICINVSNATLNGTYRPYIAPSEYALDLPILRGVNDIHDDKEKVRIGVLKLKDIATWRLSSAGKFYATGMSDYKNINSDLKNGLSNKYLLGNYTDWSNSVDGIIFIVSSTSVLYLTDSRYSTLEAFLESLSDNDYLLYELATPTDQPTITLPENIVIQKGGTLTAEYDNSGKAPSDFEFDIATIKIV